MSGTMSSLYHNILFELQRIYDWYHSKRLSFGLISLSVAVLWFIDIAMRAFLGATGRHWVLSFFTALIMGFSLNWLNSEKPHPRRKERRRPEPLVLSHSSASISTAISTATTTFLKSCTLKSCTPLATAFLRTPQVGDTFYEDSSVVTSFAPPTSSSSHSPNLNSLATLFERQLGPLPSKDWEMRLSSNMRVYFADKKSRRTTWRDPRLLMAPLSPKPRTPGSPGMCHTPLKFTTRDRQRVAEWLMNERRNRRKLDTLRQRVRMSKFERRLGGRGICELIE